MMKACKCGSYAINHNCHGRDGSDDDLCDVCYWRKRAEQPAPMIRGDIRDGLVDDEPAQQHIEHCLWARNGNQPCPHVQQAQQHLTKAFRYDLSPAMIEGEIRDKLIELGWTPPEQQAQQEHFDHKAAANAALRDAQNRSYQVAKSTQPAQPSKPLTDEQWQVIANTLHCCISRGQKDTIEAALGIKEST